MGLFLVLSLIQYNISAGSRTLHRDWRGTHPCGNFARTLALDRNRTLGELSLADCPNVGGEGARCLAAMLVANSTLSHLALDGAPQARHAIDRAIRKWPSFRTKVSSCIDLIIDSFSRSRDG
jgi:hypothetical protein